MKSAAVTARAGTRSSPSCADVAGEIRLLTDAPDRRLNRSSMREYFAPRAAPLSCCAMRVIDGFLCSLRGRQGTLGLDAKQVERASDFTLHNSLTIGKFIGRYAMLLFLSTTGGRPYRYRLSAKSLLSWEVTKQSLRPQADPRLATRSLL